MKAVVRLLFIVSACAGLLLSLPPRAAHAKSPGWILAGGELGSHAAFFWGITEDPQNELWQIEGPVVDAPATDPGTRYDVFPDWFIDAEAFKTPMVSYYPEAGLLYGHDPENTTDRWMRAEGAVKTVLDQAIEQAVARLARGPDPVGDRNRVPVGVIEATPLLASFRQRGMDGGTYTFVPAALKRYGEGSLPLLVVEPGEGEGGSEEFAMVHLAATLTGKPRWDYPPTSPDYDFRISAPFNGGSWGGPIGSYWMPTDGAPGLLVVSGGTGPRPVYETTSGFDAFMERAIAEAEAAVAQPSAQPGQGPGQTGPSVEHRIGREAPRGDSWVAVAGVAGLMGLVAGWAVVGTLANRR